MIQNFLPSLSHDKIDKLEKLVDLFIGWNARLNLSSIREKNAINMKHVVDSLLIEKLAMIEPGMSVLDMGTGGGFPGLPLAIAYPEATFTLVDATKKKIDAVEDMTVKLGLTNVSFLNSRAEQLAHSPSHREQYDLVVARALAEFSTLLEYCVPFVKMGGYFIAYQGPEIVDQIEASETAQRILGVEVVDRKEFELPEGKGERILIVCQKIAETPAEYPRRVGLPKKRPLGEGLK